MNIKKNTSQAATIDSGAVYTLRLSDSLDITMIESLYRQLETALAAKQSVLMLDAGQVSRVDSAALQLLAVFCREAREQGYSVRWRKPSSALCHAAAWLGLSDWLEIKARRKTTAAARAKA